MKKLIYIAIFLQLSVSSLLLADPGDPNVFFSDPNLEIAVADTLGLEAPVTEGEMLNLYSLTASNLGIFDLTGLEYATDVNELHLSGNLLSDPNALLPISDLPSLKYLNLNNNQIADLPDLFLVNATDVNELHLSGNLLSDPNALLPISDLTNLIYLYLNDNQITDISAVSNLINLETLFLSVNNINDISPVSGLTVLTSLYLGSNDVNDISDLSGLSNLTVLDLTDNRVDDISVVSTLTSLAELYLSDNQVVDISAVSNLASLQYLYLTNNQVDDIGDMSNLVSLQYLHLTNNLISDISGLAGEEPNDLISLLLTQNPLDLAAYCTYLPAIEFYNPLIYIDVDDNPGSCLPHDICSTAVEIFKNVADANSTDGATGPEEESSCGVWDYNDVWHSYTPDSNEVVDISLCGSSLDTSLVVYDSCPDTGGMVLACNDDYCDSQSLVTVGLTGGETYLIRVAGYDETTGDYELVITDAPEPPINNTCQDANEIFQYDDPVTGSTTLAYGTDITSCTTGDTRDVWYYFTPTFSGLYLIDPNGSDYDTSLAVFDGCGGTELTCNDDYANYDYWGDPDVRTSRIVVSMDEGETYYIRISGYSGMGGNYSLTVTLASDINIDGVVDTDDLLWLIQDWVQEGTSYADIAPEEANGGEDGGGDKFIDVLDFAELCKQWLANPLL